MKFVTGEKLFAYFSEEHINLKRTILLTSHTLFRWRCVTVEGEIVTATSFGSSLVPSDSGYMWPDARSIGQVIAYLAERETVRSEVRVDGGQIRHYVHPDVLTRQGWSLQDGVWLPAQLGQSCQLASLDVEAGTDQAQ